MKKDGLIILVGVGVVLLGGVIWASDFTDRTPRIDLEEMASAFPAEEAPREPATMEERMAEVESLVARLYRITDPFDHRDEMRLERRVRELEGQVERLEREIRRLETQVRR